MRNKSSKLESVVGSTDSTEPRAAEEMLLIQTQLLDVTHDSIFVRDINDAITYWNRGAEELYGWKKEEALGRVTHQLLQTVFPMPLEEIMAKVSCNGCWEGELVHTKRSGAHVTVVSRWSLQRYGQGGLAVTFETNNDITERRRAEETVAKLQAEMVRIARIMTMGEVATSLAHEVNQPLAGVVLNAKACLRWLGGDSPQLEEARYAIQRIIRDGKRASDIIARMNDAIEGIQQVISHDPATREQQRAMAELRTRYESLTPREREVLERVVCGLLNKQISADLGISEITVKVHRRHVMDKMMAATLADLVRISARLGIPQGEELQLVRLSGRRRASSKQR